MSSERDRLVERILSGEIDMRSEAVRADPELARELDETLETLASLDEKQVMIEVARDGDERAGEDIAQLVRRELRARARPRVRRLLPLLAAAVAASILVLVFFHEGAGTPDIPPIPMGEEVFECVAPRGAGADFAVFRWTNGASGGTYSIEVYGPDGEPVAGGESGPLGDVREWTPDPEMTARWGDAIEWQLSWDRPGGGRAKIVFSEASR